MEIAVHTLKRADLIVVGGSIDNTAATDFIAVLDGHLDRRRYNLVIDMEQVCHLSASGVHGLIGALKRSRRAGGRVLIVAPSPGVQQVFELVGIDRLFEIYDTQVEAVASF